MAAYITVLNYVYSLCVFYYGVLSCVADVADCPLQRLSVIVINSIIVIIIIVPNRRGSCREGTVADGSTQSIRGPTNH